MKNHKKLLFIALAFLIVILLELSMLTVDFCRIYNFEEPIFAHCQIKDEENRIYNGIGYSFEVRGHFDIDHPLYGIKYYRFYLLGSFIRDGQAE